MYLLFSARISTPLYYYLTFAYTQGRSPLSLFHAFFK
jgi:hypothetical protein